MSDQTSLAQALANLDEAMRPSSGGSTDPARRRVAQRLAQLARCEDEDLPAFAKRHMPGRTVEESGLRAARDLLLVIGGIADMEDGGPDAWAALDEVRELLERRLAEAKESALKRKAEAEEATADASPSVAPMQPQGTAAPLSSVAPAPSPPFAVAPAPAGPVPFSAPARAVVEPLPFTSAAAAVPPPAPVATPLPAPVLSFGGLGADDGTSIVVGAVAARNERALFIDDPVTEDDVYTVAGVSAAAHARVLPFSPVSPAPTPAASSQEPAAGSLPADRFTLAEYANLCAGLRAHPTHVTWIRGQYGLTEEDWAALHTHWHARLQSDPALMDQWQQMVVQSLPYWQR